MTSRSVFSAPFLAGMAVAAVLGAFAAPSTAQVPADLVSALANPSRPAADTERDAVRRPGEVLALANIKRGDKVADFIIGGGYFTRILSGAVGPTGKVYAYQPAEFIKFQAKYGDDLKAAAAFNKNITTMDGSLTGLELPDGLDAVITVQNYHDLHLSPFPADTAAKINAEVFKSLKPGGVFLVVDHAAAPGSADAPNKLHRIEVATVKSEVEAAGFKLAAESPLLHSAADPHTASVFDPSIRGKTDQFILKFVKP